MRILTKAAMAGALALGLLGAVAAPAVVYADGGPKTTMGHSRHTDGRIAFLKAELKITPAQEAEWGAVEKAMRDGAAERTKMYQAYKADKGKPMTAVDRLALREKHAEANAKSISAFASAFKPLYDHMSDDQRKAADALFQPHGHRG